MSYAMMSERINEKTNIQRTVNKNINQVNVRTPEHTHVW